MTSCSPTRAIAFALMALVPLSACSDPAPACTDTLETTGTFPPALAAELDRIAVEELDAASALGATITVQIPGMGVHAAAAGFRDDDLTPVTGRTRFRIGSITKTFHTATALLLEDAGEISLDANASEALPALPIPASVTHEMLLLHTSGIFNYTDDIAFLNYLNLPWTAGEIITWAIDEHDAPHAPGDAYSYSNTGFHVSALMLEAATNEPYHALVRRHVIAPLALDDTRDEYGEGRPACGFSDGYVARGANMTEEIDMIWAWAAGGMVSTGADLCRWAEAVYRSDFLPPAQRARMLSVTAESADAGERYGLGTRHTTRGGVDVVGHTGSTMGYKGELFIDPETGVCVAVLTNDFLSTPTRLSGPAWAAVLDALP